MNKMGGGHNELTNFILVWTVVITSLCYCHTVGKYFPRGTIVRPLTIIPVVCLFFIIPLNLTTLCLGGPTSFFVAWLANFKLILFIFEKGPLSSNPPIPLRKFIAIACLPIKAVQQYSSGSKLNKSPTGHKPLIVYVSKFILLIFSMQLCNYIHPKFLVLLYFLILSCSLELLLAMIAALARALLKLELEPQFGEPCLATSLQDFWSRKWNLMVTDIMRLTVYDPVRSFCTPVAGRNWSSLPAVMSTFLVSGLMHELIFYNIGRLKPTGEFTCFFLISGVFLAAEVGIKIHLDKRFWLPVILSRSLTLAYMLTSSFLLLFPPMLRGKVDAKGCTEILALIEFLKSGQLISPSHFSCPFL